MPGTALHPAPVPTVKPAQSSTLLCNSIQRSHSQLAQSINGGGVNGEKFAILKVCLCEQMHLDGSTISGGTSSLTHVGDADQPRPVRGFPALEVVWRLRERCDRCMPPMHFRQRTRRWPFSMGGGGILRAREMRTVAPPSASSPPPRRHSAWRGEVIPAATRAQIRILQKNYRHVCSGLRYYFVTDFFHVRRPL